MKILITGGTGLIGKHVAEKLQEEGFEVHILTRNKNPKPYHFYWDYTHKEIDENALEGIDGIIHLAGANIGHRWTTAYRKEMIRSRVESLQFLEECLLQKNIELQFLISASGVNYYGTDSTLHLYNENDIPGSDFLSNLCVEWEKAVHNFSVPVQRKTLFRTAVVLTHKGGVLAKLLPSFKMGMGAILGHGRQIMPCISLDDIVGLYLYSIHHKLEGTYNAVGFNITQKELAQTLAQRLGKPIFLKIPPWLLSILLGKMSTLLLEGSPISNIKIKSEGFSFQDTSIQSIELD